MNLKLKQIIEDDLQRYGYQKEEDLGFSVRRYLYGFKFTKILRKCKWYKDHNKKLLFWYNRLLLDKYSIKYGFQISYATEIGRGFYIGHFGAVVINSSAVIGSNVNISQGVTIGISNSGKNKGVPRIGNNVWIGANSTVVGGIEIGDDVVIAPNTFVNFDVPAHSVVIGSRAEIHPKENATEHFVQNVIKV